MVNVKQKIYHALNIVKLHLQEYHIEQNSKTFDNQIKGK